MLSVETDVYFMKEAIKEAKKAKIAGEVPVGAVVVAKNKIIARAHNQTELLNDVTAHAEMMAITSAAAFLGSKYLNQCTIFITLEPCVMCAGGLKWAQLGKVVYGASDDQKGFMNYGKELLHPKTKLEFGVLYEECSQLLLDFFDEKRRLQSRRL
jgi:tRNA(adenine34) deaminase